MDLSNAPRCGHLLNPEGRLACVLRKGHDFGHVYTASEPTVSAHEYDDGLED